MLMQCNDVCPEGDGWNSRITISIREARFIFITWMPDSQASLYVVQYRLRNTPVYTSSLEVRDPVACVCDGIMCLFTSRYHPPITTSHNWVQRQTMKYRFVGPHRLHFLMIVETACFVSAQFKLEVYPDWVLVRSKSDSKFSMDYTLGYRSVCDLRYWGLQVQGGVRSIETELWCVTDLYHGLGYGYIVAILPEGYSENPLADKQLEDVIIGLSHSSGQLLNKWFSHLLLSNLTGQYVATMVQ